MRIAFISGTFGQGSDGVGDYICGLAEECSRLGHSCCILSLNDRKVFTFTSGCLVAHDFTVPLFRCPEILPWETRLSAAEEFLRSFSPEWISLHFVNYAFAQNGLIRHLGKRLFPLVARRYLHVMMHELWVGVYSGGPLRNKLHCLRQRPLVLKFLRNLAPRVIHTTNPVYAAELKRRGISSVELPLFGSIPLAPAASFSWLYTKLTNSGIPVSETTRADYYFIGAFATLWLDTLQEKELFAFFAKLAERLKKKLVFISIGRGPSGSVMHGLSSRCLAQIGAICSFATLGVQAPHRISQCFQMIDLGFSTHSYEDLGRSSAFAAMIDHGLRVLVPRSSWHHSDFTQLEPEQESAVLRPSDRLLEQFEQAAERQTPCPRRKEIALKFLSSLTQAAGPL